MLSDVVSKQPYCQTTFLSYTNALPPEAACRLAEELLSEEEAALVRTFFTMEAESLAQQAHKIKFSRLFKELAHMIEEVTVVVMNMNAGGLVKTIEAFPVNASHGKVTTLQGLKEMVRKRDNPCALITIDLEESFMVHLRTFKSDILKTFRLKNETKNKLLDMGICAFEKTLSFHDIPESTLRRIVREEVTKAIGQAKEVSTETRVPSDDKNVYKAIHDAVAQL